jgi:pimeloyl-ACP methyl ester carboxylesterase
LQPVERPLAGRRILLFVHGAFSNSNHLVDELRATAGGVAFLNRAAAHYNQVLAFNHPTLSVSPVLNALDLKRLFQEAKAQVDVVCHSRGGLVARWWCEVLSGGCVPRRVVFVGAPLAGTSLAAASRLREALNLLTNIGHALSLAADTASAAVPFLTVAGGLIRMITSISGVLGKAPIVDAAVALFPGLASMSRVGNNAELLRLRASGVMPACEYFAVKSNFEPTDPGWAFWRYFTKVKERAAEAVANIIFDGPNDLVVDTDSMGELAENLSIPAGRIYDFGTTDRVHHANYFRQDAALDFIAKSLGVPK